MLFVSFVVPFPLDPPLRAQVANAAGITRLEKMMSEANTNATGRVYPLVNPAMEGGEQGPARSVNPDPAAIQLFDMPESLLRSDEHGYNFAA